MTLLYYSVKESIRTLQNAYYPADLFSASIVTFTDGEDDGSVYYENRYLHHYLNLDNHSTSVSSTSGAKVSSMSRYSVVIPV